MDHGISSIMRIGKPLIGKINMEKTIGKPKNIIGDMSENDYVIPLVITIGHFSGIMTLSLVKLLFFNVIMR